jgi:hypothetical protein
LCRAQPLICWLAAPTYEDAERGKEGSDRLELSWGVCGF